MATNKATIINENMKFPNNAKNLFLGLRFPYCEPLIAYTNPTMLMVPATRIGIATRKSFKTSKAVPVSTGLTIHRYNIENRNSPEDRLTIL